MRLKSALRRGVAAAVIAGIVVSSGIPAYAGTWDIADGNITVKAGDEGTNNVKQGDNDFVKDEGDTIITGESKENTVTIDTSEGNVDVTFDDLKIDASSGNEAAVSVTGKGDTNIELDGDNELKSGNRHAGLEHNKTDTSGKLTIQDKDKNGSLDATGGFRGAGIGGGEAQNGQVTITANSEIGASKEIVNIDRMGSDIDIAFNAKYFSDVLKVLDDEYVCLDMNTNISPCVVKPETGDEYYYLILPVRLFAGN